jgi:hypothetical protein
LKIRLFTTIYPEKDPQRQGEYQKCLQLNAECPSIDEICVLSEGGEELLPESPNFKIRKVQGRPTYGQYFQWISEIVSGDDISIIANTDIYFDQQLELFRHWKMPSNIAIALARWDVADGVPQLFDRNDSQDAWFFRGPLKKVTADFPVGVPRCDNRFLYELKQAGYEIINPAFSIRAYHLHAGQRGEYQTQQHFVDPPYAYLWPHNLWSLPRTLVHNLRQPQARVSWRFDKRKLMASIPLRALKKAWSLVRPANRSAAQKH